MGFFSDSFSRISTFLPSNFANSFSNSIISNRVTFEFWSKVTKKSTSLFWEKSSLIDEPNIDSSLMEYFLHSFITSL